MGIRQPVIAVVDDDHGVRKAIGRLLSVSGYRTELYASSGEFLGAAATSEATCLVVDIQLGDGLGVELVRKLSASGFTWPIIFITGANYEPLRRQAMELNCIAYLQKPLLADDLIAAIESANGSNPGHNRP